MTSNAWTLGPDTAAPFRRGAEPRLRARYTPGDIANVVAFLAGPDGGWINGQVLRANGGMV